MQFGANIIPLKPCHLFMGRPWFNDHNAIYNPHLNR